MSYLLSLIVLCASILDVGAQLTGSVGPTTSLASKSNLCNVLDYGGTIGSSDIGPAILSAFNVRCAQTANSMEAS